MITRRVSKRIPEFHCLSNKVPAPALPFRWLCSSREDSTTGGGGDSTEDTVTGRKKSQPHHDQKPKPEETESPTTATTHTIIIPPNTPHASPNLSKTEINHTPNPITQQKRSSSSSNSATCTSGPPVEFDNPTEDWIQSGSKEAEEDDKEYFSHNKPSSLSEIEFADTRKPITRATDATTIDGVGGGYYGSKGTVDVWMPEQLETAEETMERAMEIWNLNKMRGGDPDAKQSRVLRALRGESEF